MKIFLKVRELSNAGSRGYTQEIFSMMKLEVRLSIFDQNEFTKILVSETSTYFIGDRHAPSETDMPHRRLTCPIGDLTCLWRPIKDQHSSESNRNFNTYLNILINIYYLLIYIYHNNARTPIRHVGLWRVIDQACRSTLCLRLVKYFCL